MPHIQVIFEHAGASDDGAASVSFRTVGGPWSRPTPAVAGPTDSIGDRAALIELAVSSFRRIIAEALRQPGETLSQRLCPCGRPVYKFGDRCAVCVPPG